MRRFRQIALAALAVAAMLGCGHVSPADDNQEADPQPITVTQLLGVWDYVTDGDYASLEFLPEGHAIIAWHPRIKFITAPAREVEYALEDDRTLTLIEPGGHTKIFQATITADILELTNQGDALSGIPTQRFRKRPMEPPTGDSPPAE